MANYLVYLPKVEEGGEHPSRENLTKIFGEDKVYMPSGGGIFVIKAGSNLSDLMNKLGIDDENKRTGFVSRIEPNGINGWFSRALWDFLSS